MNYVPRLAKVVNVLAIRKVKQGTETTRFRYPYRLYSALLSLCYLLIYNNCCKDEIFAAELIIATGRVLKCCFTTC